MGPRIFPFMYCFFPSLLPLGENSLVLDGANNGWGIPVFPVKREEEKARASSTSANSSNGTISSTDECDFIVGQATPRNAHIADGRAGIFGGGLLRANSGISNKEGSVEPFSSDEALMQVSFHGNYHVVHPRMELIGL